MLPGPMFRRELKAATRFGELVVLRTVLGLLAAAVAILACLAPLGWAGLTQSEYEPHQLQTYCALVLIAVIFIETFFVMTQALTMVSPAVAEEREKDTLPLLLLTRLSRVEIVVTKLIARLLPSLSLVLVGFPLAAACAWCAGLPASVLLEAMAMVTSSVIVAGGVGILASARRDRVGTARAQALTWVFLWFLIIPVCSIIPFKSGTLWGDLAVELRRLCTWIAPSSPISLATQYSWFLERRLDVLTEQFVVMLVLQAALIVMAVVAAAFSLRLRERHVFAWDAYQGFRPAVGDDPVFWREYTLPFRGAKRPLVFYQARQIVILLRALFITAIQLALMAIAVAVPIGLAIATARYGYFAFRELASDGYSPAGPTPARDQFNLLVRGLTGILTLIPLLSLPAMTTGRITIERDKKTWDGLLATPLTGAEILSAKMRVGARGLWRSSRWLIPLWILGIVVGSVNPLTALLAGLELPLAAWASLVLGVWLGVRPRSGSTSTANSHAALASFGVAAVVGSSVLVLLCTHRELAEFGTWDIRLRAIVVVSLLALPPLVGAAAWALERRTYRRFDEWVGRPYRPSP
jgi:ABC-type transport system involved in multi-copper enzyme maturation permease subunit